jgi:HPt (histidine-containing phosphotransfer) domain-containing protein
MMILEARSAIVAADVPPLSSIDPGVVKQMFGDDLALFKSLLARVLRDFADFALPILIAYEDPTVRSELKARAHKLRGSAGVIGATRIARLAAEIEQALEEDRPADMLEEMLRRLATALTSLREEADLVFQKDAEVAARTDSKPANRVAVGAGDIDELCSLLERQDLAALDRFELLSASLNDLVGAVRFDRLRDAISNLDFQLGAQLLRQALMVERADDSVEAHQPMLTCQ